MAEPKLDPIELKAEADPLAEKSDRSRIDFLRTELRTCFILAGVAEAQQGMCNPEHAARSLAEAETGYATLLHYMSDPKHAKHIREEDRLELTADIARLRAQLDNLAPK